LIHVNVVALECCQYARIFKEQSMAGYDEWRSSKCCGLAIAVFLLAAELAQADGDVVKGEQVFKKCKRNSGCQRGPSSAGFLLGTFY
jgi:hypothetical protein